MFITRSFVREILKINIVDTTASTMTVLDSYKDSIRTSAPYTLPLEVTA